MILATALTFGIVTLWSPGSAPGGSSAAGTLARHPSRVVLSFPDGRADFVDDESLGRCYAELVFL